MKKVICLFCAAVTALTISACNNGGEAATETTERATEQQRDVFLGAAYTKPGEVFSVTDSLDVGLKSIKTTEVIEPLMQPDYLLVQSEYRYESEKTDCAMVDVVFEVENVGDDEIKCREIAVASAVGEKGEYSGEKFFLECNNYRSLTEHTSLSSGEKTLFHAVLYIPHDEKRVTIKVKFDAAELLYDYKIGQEVKNENEALFGEEIIGEKKSVAVNGISFANELHPSTESTDAYTYYRIEDDKKIYAITEAVLTNDSDEDIGVYDFVKMSLKMGSETLEGMWVCENDSGEAFDTENVIAAGKSVRTYYIAEIQKSDTGKQYEVNLVLDLEEYRLKRK